MYVLLTQQPQQTALFSIKFHYPPGCSPSRKTKNNKCSNCFPGISYLKYCGIFRYLNTTFLPAKYFVF